MEDFSLALIDLLWLFFLSPCLRFSVLSRFIRSFLVKLECNSLLQYHSSLMFDFYVFHAWLYWLSIKYKTTPYNWFLVYKTCKSLSSYLNQAFNKVELFLQRFVFVSTAAVCMLSLMKRVVKIIVCHNWRLSGTLVNFCFPQYFKAAGMKCGLIPNANHL